VDNRKLISVITTIHAPTQCVRDLAILLSAVHAPLVIIGDSAGPFEYPVAGADFWSLARQNASDFALSPLLPVRHYSRKNLGYLVAMSMGAECIYETDDDNAPLPQWSARTLETSAVGLAGSHWVNVYRWFSEGLIWPRGLPLEFIRDLSTIPTQKIAKRPHLAPIQQGLANISPDVDAVWRLVLNGEFKFNRKQSVVVPVGSWCPFNSQSTWWWFDAYPLLYLPSYCSFRLTDTWRSFVAQRCLWELNLGVVFHAPEVYQDRNPHLLLRDFESEIPGYLKNDALVSSLEKLPLKPGLECVTENVMRCYERLVEEGFLPKEEILLVRAWTRDIEKIRTGSDMGVSKCLL
jgi:hypothetical protein